MLKQFLMHMITDISCSGFGDFNSTAAPSGGAAPAVPVAAAAGAVASAVSVANPVSIVACGGEFEVSAERREDFFSLVCDRQRAECFLKAYALPTTDPVACNDTGVGLDLGWQSEEP